MYLSQNLTKCRWNSGQQTNNITVIAITTKQPDIVPAFVLWEEITMKKKKYFEICFKNSKKCHWEYKKEFTDYNYDGKCIVVKKNEQLVAVYPVDAIRSFVFFKK